MKHRWRDIGRDRIKCELTGEIARMTKTRQIVGNNQAIIFSDEEWGKLVQLGKKRRRTPEQCIRDFVANCQPGDTGWLHPMVVKS